MTKNYRDILNEFKENRKSGSRLKLDTIFSASMGPLSYDAEADKLVDAFTHQETAEIKAQRLG